MLSLESSRTLETCWKCDANLWLCSRRWPAKDDRPVPAIGIAEGEASQRETGQLGRGSRLVLDRGVPTRQRHRTGNGQHVYVVPRWVPLRFRLLLLLLLLLNLSTTLASVSFVCRWIYSFECRCAAKITFEKYMFSWLVLLITTKSGSRETLIERFDWFVGGCPRCTALLAIHRRFLFNLFSI